MYKCPKCGVKQEGKDQCQQCGFIFNKENGSDFLLGLFFLASGIIIALVSLSMSETFFGLLGLGFIIYGCFLLALKRVFSVFFKKPTAQILETIKKRRDVARDRIDDEKNKYSPEEARKQYEEEKEKKLEARLVNIVQGDTKKNAGLSAVLSFFVPGIGQIFNGEIAKGFTFLLGYTLSWGFCIGTLFGGHAWGILFLIITIMICVSAIYDAYTTAIAINNFIDSTKYLNMKKCPYCAEMVKEEAIICRYCNRDLEQTI